jgi:predicted PurR-regulated permease PerM
MPPAPSARVVARTVLIVVGVLLALYIVYLLRRPITWVLIAGFIAVALSPPVNFLHERIGRRGPAIAIVYVTLILLPIGLGALIVPPVVRQANDLVRDLPAYAEQTTEFVQGNGTLRRLQEDYDITAKLEEQAASLPERIGSAAGTLGSIGVGLVNSVFAIVTILILSVFLVGSGRRWVDAGLALRPPRQADRLRRTLERISKAIGAYVAGALAQATVAGVTTYIVLLVLGVPFAGPLALVVAFADLIPLVGATIGAVIVGIVTLFTDFPTATIIWVIWSVIYQQVENTVIQPQIQKRAVDVHPFVVLVAVLFGSTLFGVLGALMAIPIAASLQIIVREYLRLRRYEPLPEPPPGAVKA